LNQLRTNFEPAPVPNQFFFGGKGVTETQTHMEATYFVICIHVILHCPSMFKPHLIKQWLSCFLYSHMLPIRSRQTGSLPKLLHSHFQREQDTLTSPKNVPYQSTGFSVRPSAERF